MLGLPAAQFSITPVAIKGWQVLQCTNLTGNVGFTSAVYVCLLCVDLTNEYVTVDLLPIDTSQTNSNGHLSTAIVNKARVPLSNELAQLIEAEV